MLFRSIAFVLAYLTYPSCLGQMFRGQRGAQATSNFFDFSNTLTRISFFWELLDEYVFGKTLLLLLVLLIIAAVFAGFTVRKRKKYNAAYGLLFFAVTGYFLAVSKTALLLGNTSVRYQTPIYGIVVLLLFGAIWGGWNCCCELRGDKKNCIGEKIVLAAAILYMLAGLAGLFSGRVVFLYPEAAERVSFAREKAAAGVPVVCLYDAGQSWCVWDCADEFFEYDRIYFASQNDTEPILDAVIADSGELIVYLSNTAEKQEQLERIRNSNPNLTAYELRYQEKYCDVYYFHE